MDISEIIKKLCNNINYIFDKERNIKYTGKFKPILYKHIYSSSLNPNLKIENNGKVLPIRGLVNYNCPNCSEINEILLKRFLSKKSLKCSKCKENDYEKRENQSQWIKKSYSEFGKVVSKDKIKTQF